MFNHYCDVEPDSRVFLVEKAKGCVLASLAQIVQPPNGQIYLCDYRNDTFQVTAYPALKFVKVDNSRDVISVIPPIMALELKQHKEALQFTHVIIAAQLNVVEILQSVHENLQPNGKVVVYSRFIGTLEKVAALLFERKDFINIQVCDTMMRKMQVLAQRTHPEMSGPNFGGFILTAYKVAL